MNISVFVYTSISPYRLKFHSSHSSLHSVLHSPTHSFPFQTQVSQPSSFRLDGRPEVACLLDGSSGLSLESRCAYLGILAGKHPVRVLQAMLRYLDEGSGTGKFYLEHRFKTFFTNDICSQALSITYVWLFVTVAKCVNEP